MFSDQVELFIPPKKGRSHVLRIIRELIEFKPKSSKTNFSQALRYFFSLMKKRAIVFVISDFMTDDYEQTLKIVGKRHDVTGIRVYDSREEKMPNIGIVAMTDAETAETRIINTGSRSVRMEYENYYYEKVRYFKDVFGRCGSGVVNIRVDESYVIKLLGYFKTRS